MCSVTSGPRKVRALKFIALVPETSSASPGSVVQKSQHRLANRDRVENKTSSIRSGRIHAAETHIRNGPYADWSIREPRLSSKSPSVTHDVALWRSNSNQYFVTSWPIRYELFERRERTELSWLKNGRQMQLCFMRNSHLKLLQQMSNPTAEIVTQGFSLLFPIQVVLGQPLS